MTRVQSPALTHMCRSCGRHFSLYQVREVHAAEHTPEGEAEVLVCPVCGSYDLDPLSEVPNAG